MALMEALQELGQYRQFVAYTLIRLSTGKLDKIPTCWRTGAVGVDPHNPAYWGSYHEVEGSGFPVAFVLTANDPFFCIDLDGAWNGTEWSKLSQDVLQIFPTAAREVSRSGTGMHVWGKYSSMPAHKCSRNGLAIEVYHEKRFIALGFNGAGTVSVDCTRNLGLFLSHYQLLREAPIANPNSEWTEGPSTDWRGPTDDAALIQRACASGSHAALFGGKVRFIDFWTANEETLSTVYPPRAPRPDGLRYDASAVDLAFASHLRFWTGGDCERMLRLMKTSKLNRDKYDRDGYLHNTILLANSTKGQVYCEKGKQVSEEGTASVKVNEGSPFVTPEEQAAHFNGCVYVAQEGKILTGKGQMIDRARFDVLFGGKIFILDREHTKTTTSAWECFTNSRAVRFPKVDAACFNPRLPPQHLSTTAMGWLVVNTYFPISTPRRPGDPTPFVDLIRRILPEEVDQQVLLSFIAAVVQYPGVKFMWAPFLQGVEGNGKSTILDCVVRAIGMEYCHYPRASLLVRQFNSWMYRKLFAVVEDVRFDEKQSGNLEELKPMITQRHFEIEMKGIDAAMREVCANMVLTSNHPRGAKKTKNDRRIAPLFCAQQEKEHLQRDGLTYEYFRQLNHWLDSGGYEIVTEFLATYRIPDALNPAFGGIAPYTTSTSAALDLSKGELELEIEERIEGGSRGFQGGWISSTALDRLIRDLKDKVDLPRNGRAAFMARMGYDKHPCLKSGRASFAIHEFGETCRPVLYLRAGHLAYNLTDGREITRQYMVAQEEAMKEAAADRLQA